EFGDRGLRRGNALARTFDAVAAVHEAKEKFGFRLEPEIAQRREKCRIASVARHRHVNPLDRALDARADAVCDLDQIRRVLRFDEVLMSAIAIAEVIA